MNDYLQCLLALFVALSAQAVVAGLGAKVCLRRGLPLSRRLAWVALAVAGLLLALHHGYTLELATRTGLYDLPRAMLAALRRHNRLGNRNGSTPA